MPWLLRCRWGSLVYADTFSFPVAVVKSQRRAAGRRSHVCCESRRMSGSREEGRIAKSNGRVTPGPSDLHEVGGVLRRLERPTPSGERRGTQQRVRGQRPGGDGEGPGAGSRDRQPRWALVGWIRARALGACLQQRKPFDLTQKQKPENPRLPGMCCLYVQ